MGVSLEAEVGISLGEHLDKLSDAVKGISPDHVTLTNPAGGVIGATVALLDLGGPQGSFVWNIRRVTCGPVPGTAVTLGTALYICKGSAGALGNQVVCDIAPVLPSAATYGSGEFVIRSPHHLVIVWLGGTGQLFVDADVVEQPRITKFATIA
jgi:hypothetical protein